MEDILELVKSLVQDGEAKLEVSLRLVRNDDQPKRMPRPYDTDGRLSGYRGIARRLGTAVGFVQDRVKSGKMPVYREGRKIYAYTDEIMLSIAKERESSPTVRRIFKEKGYGIRMVAVAPGGEACDAV